MENKIKLMESYLENRKQYVRFDTRTSDIKYIRNGVPQGLILGPLLFLIYKIQDTRDTRSFISGTKPIVKRY